MTCLHPRKERKIIDDPHGETFAIELELNGMTSGVHNGKDDLLEERVARRE